MVSSTLPKSPAPTDDASLGFIRRLDAAFTRALDIVMAIAALLLLAPLLAVIAIAIRLGEGGPVLFRQERVGLGGASFVMLKFRTLPDGTDDALAREMIRRELAGENVATDGSFKPPNGAHVKRIGSMLRRTSLDELPQLVNVVRGEMALVGPRPCLPWEAEMFPPSSDPRFSVKPGITGLWQVSGRSTMGTLQMLAIDNEYARTRNFGRDIAILCRTVPALFAPNGAR